jgi:hypothetical protein
MKSSLPLGRIAGVRVQVDVSAVSIVVIPILSLAFGRLPLALPGRSTVAHLAAVVGFVSPSNVSRTLPLASLTRPNTPARGADRWPAHPGT